MQDLLHRAAIAALVVCGVLIAGSQVEAAGAVPLVQHRQFMLGLLGAGLVLSAFVSALRAAGDRCRGAERSVVPGDLVEGNGDAGRRGALEPPGHNRAACIFRRGVAA